MGGRAPSSEGTSRSDAPRLASWRVVLCRRLGPCGIVGRLEVGEDIKVLTEMIITQRLPYPGKVDVRQGPNPRSAIPQRSPRGEYAPSQRRGSVV